MHCLSSTIFRHGCLVKTIKKIYNSGSLKGHEMSIPLTGSPVVLKDFCIYWNFINANILY